MKIRRPPGIGARLRWIISLGLIASSCLIIDSAPRITERRVDQLASADGWSVLNFETRNLASATSSVFAQIWSGPARQDPTELRDFLRGPLGADLSREARLLTSIVTDQLRAGQVEAVGGAVFPPLAFALAPPPRLLVVSPRERIEVSHSVLLRDDLPLAELDRVERTIERLGVSAFVVDSVAIATYPTLIPPDLSPRSAIRTIAHEWTHVALFFTPLGQAYGTSVEARSINEATADLVGEEVLAGVLQAAGEPTGEKRAPVDQEASTLLREIRARAEALLSSGHVAAAEAAMEEGRKDLESRGYRFRRLNQAFFAFYGSYTEGPGASQEIPDRLRELRLSSTSINELLARVGQIVTMDQLRRTRAE